MLRLIVCSQISMCDFGTVSSTTPRVIAPSKLLSADLDMELTNGVNSSILQGLTQTMAVTLDQQIIVYLGYSAGNGHFLSKVHLIIMYLKEYNVYTV